MNETKLTAQELAEKYKEAVVNLDRVSMAYYSELMRQYPAS